ncbi:hypothetical protein A3I42_01770 [Candidatus Uhrbacteria bacterium RIFCSPLOWO2_02_FULL_49_11]|uniref:Uncharacterized protein n=1 Tax=Candidatus Uhrbacteria bacterium RIFCSPLOWO2_02_FULL_49_11 TaxID=1802409 RepID=A0A1F7VB31_9BACT|nr:MAG: hypothetical protein A3I42_01770 [Candidatus Uhrbacteria bacterium RIFCSPLOWO2_02_FULL_49_11]
MPESYRDNSEVKVDADALLATLAKDVTKAQEEISMARQAQVSGKMERIENNRVEQAKFEELIGKAEEAQVKISDLESNPEVLEKIPKATLSQLKDLIARIPWMKEEISRLEAESDEALAVEGVESARQVEAAGANYRKDLEKWLEGKEVGDGITNLVSGLETWGAERRKAFENQEKTQTAMNQAVSELFDSLGGLDWEDRVKDNDLRFLFLELKQKNNIITGTWGDGFIRRLQEIRDGYKAFSNREEKAVIKEALALDRLFLAVDRSAKEYQQSVESVRGSDSKFKEIAGNYSRIRDQARDYEQQSSAQYQNSERYKKLSAEELRGFAPTGLLAKKVGERFESLIKEKLNVQAGLGGTEARGKHRSFREVEQDGNQGEKTLLNAYRRLLDEDKNQEASQ